MVMLPLQVLIVPSIGFVSSLCLKGISLMVITLTQKSFSIPLIMVLNGPFTIEKRTIAPILSHLSFALLLQLLGLINRMNLDTYEGFERVKGDKQHETTVFRRL